MLCVPKDFGRLKSPDGAEFTTAIKEIVRNEILLPFSSSCLTLIDHGVGRGHPLTGAPAVGRRGAPGAVSALEVAA